MSTSYVSLFGAVATLPATATILRVAVWCAFLVVISFTTADPDLWGHVRFGLDILRDANIHQVDAYSFASDRAWVNHEWGAEVISGSAFAIGGSAGLVALKMLIVGATLLLLNAYCAAKASIRRSPAMAQRPPRSSSRCHRRTTYARSCSRCCCLPSSSGA